MRSVNKNTCLKIALIFFIITLHYFIFSGYVIYEYLIGFFYLELLLFSIIIFFICKKEILLFDPIVLFSAYYILVYISAFFLMINDFEGNYYYDKIEFYNNKNQIFNIACFYYLIAYLSTLFGYILFYRSIPIKFIFESKKLISKQVLNIFISLYLFIGIVSFIYNLVLHANGDLFIYLSNLSIREYEFETGGTTAGYIFLETGMYIWFYKLLRVRNINNILFILFLILSIVIKISTGRIFSVNVYIMGFFGVYYFYNISIDNKINNKKYIIFLLILSIFGILIYFLRLISSLNYNNLLNETVLEKIFDLFSQTGNIALNFGYIPNTPIFMKIIDSWDIDIGFLYGKSLFTWLNNALPSSLRAVGYQPSIILTNQWFSHYPTGNLPPTGVGEMYANFGPLGPILGMFIFGCFSALIFNRSRILGTYCSFLICTLLSYGFIMLYPKGEFDNLSLLTFLPVFLTFTLMRFITRCNIT